MSKVDKKYKVKTTRKNRDYFAEGTLDELKNYFGYVLEIGVSWNPKIKRAKEIKTIKNFITNLQKSYEEKEAQCYERTCVVLVGEIKSERR